MCWKHLFPTICSLFLIFLFSATGTFENKRVLTHAQVNRLLVRDLPPVAVFNIAAKIVHEQTYIYNVDIRLGEYMNIKIEILFDSLWA